jgi:hypothetical protein
MGEAWEAEDPIDINRCIVTPVTFQNMKADDVGSRYQTTSKDRGE